MWWAALIPIALSLMEQMNKKDNKGGAPGGQLPQVAPFNPTPMNTGEGRDQTAAALRNGAEWLQDQPDFGDEAMARALRDRNSYSIYG